MCKVKIIKNRSDIAAGTRGADMGIDALEIAAINKENDFFNRYPSIDVPTHNESIYNKVKNDFAKRIGHVYVQCEWLCSEVKLAYINNFFPLVLSGDHSSALGTLSGIKAANPDKRIGVVWIDAHADLNTPYTSSTGNIHGMPLSAAMGMDQSKWTVNNVTDTTSKYWSLMKNIGCIGPKVLPQDVVYYGVRAADKQEEGIMNEYGMTNYNVDTVRNRGVLACVKESLEKLADADIIYISVDIDSLDSNVISYGTGTPVNNGFSPNELSEIINAITESGKVSCLEFVEINPLLDTAGNKTAEAAFDIIDSAIEVVEKVL